MTAILLFPSPSQKGGVKEHWYYLVPLTLAIFSLLVGLGFRGIPIWERLLVAGISVPPITSFSYVMLDFEISWVMLTDKTWFLWENEYRIQLMPWLMDALPYSHWR